MRIRFYSAGLIVLGFLLNLGCTNKYEEEVNNFIQNYNSVLQLSYSRADLSILPQYATEKELKKVFPIIQALKATDNVMKTEILEFKLKGAKIPGEQATVLTSERWRYWWEDRKSGTVTKPKHEESYVLEYSLVKNKGGWKVDSIAMRK